MKSVLYILALLLTAAQAMAQCPVAPVNTPSDKARSLALSKLGQYFKCELGNQTNDTSPCNTFASRGLEAIYGVTDFKTGASSHQTANSMWDTVNRAGTKWREIGPVLNEQNNLCAQSAANGGWPVIAIQKAEGHGHVVLVIPGEPASSATWNMLVANSAGFLLGKPQSGYISKSLSYGFSEQNARHAVFYYRLP